MSARWAGLVGLVVCLACSNTAERRSAESTILPDTLMLMKEYRGNGLRISYPWEAHVDTAPPNREQGTRLEIVGDSLEIVKGVWRHSVDTIARSGPSYVIAIDDIPNASGRSLRQVVDSMISRYGPREPGDEDTPQLDSLLVAGQRGYVLDIPCGDCVEYEVYFGHAGRVVRLAWTTDDHDMLFGTSRPTFWFIISTFRWQ